MTRSASSESEKEGTKLYQKVWLRFCSVTICLISYRKVVQHKSRSRRANTSIPLVQGIIHCQSFRIWTFYTNFWLWLREWNYTYCWFNKRKLISCLQSLCIFPWFESKSFYLNGLAKFMTDVYSMDGALMLQSNFVGNTLFYHELAWASDVYDSHFLHLYLTDKRQTLAFYHEWDVIVSRILYWIRNFIV